MKIILKTFLTSVTLMISAFTAFYSYRQITCPPTKCEPGRLCEAMGCLGTPDYMMIGLFIGISLLLIITTIWIFIKKDKAKNADINVETTGN